MSHLHPNKHSLYGNQEFVLAGTTHSRSKQTHLLLSLMRISARNVIWANEPWMCIAASHVAKRTACQDCHNRASHITLALSKVRNQADCS